MHLFVLDTRRKKLINYNFIILVPLTKWNNIFLFRYRNDTTIQFALDYFDYITLLLHFIVTLMHLYKFLFKIGSKRILGRILNASRSPFTAPISAASRASFSRHLWGIMGRAHAWTCLRAFQGVERISYKLSFRSKKGLTGNKNFDLYSKKRSKISRSLF